MVLSELVPHLSRIVDDLTLVRSMTTESVDHESALRLIHTGKVLAGRPTWGSWVVYALGTENQNLPAYVVLSDPGGLPVDGVRNWSSGWLPAIYQGTPFRSGDAPVLNLKTPPGITAEAREYQLRFLDELNRSHAKRHPGDTELEARIANFEIAAAMQTAVPEALDLSRESEATRRMYGLDNPATREYGTRCLIARRLVERGVRFVQLFLSGQPWDTHNKNAETLKSLCARTDQPSAALVRDLKQRGLLDETIVLWTGEFGRLPVSQGTDGRDHNRHGFSLWLAGGGFKPGYVHGATDEFGYQSVDGHRDRPRPPGHASSRPGARPSQADLPPRRPARQPDRRRGHQGQGGAGAAGMTIPSGHAPSQGVVGGSSRGGGGAGSLGCRRLCRPDGLSWRSGRC